MPKILGLKHESYYLKMRKRDACIKNIEELCGKNIENHEFTYPFLKEIMADSVYYKAVGKKF